MKSRRKATLPFHWNGPNDERGRRRGILDGGQKVDAAYAVGVEPHLARRRARARRTERAEADAFGRERHRLGPARLAHGLDQPRLIGAEAVGHFLGQPLNGTRRKDMWRVALDELRDAARCGRHRGARSAPRSRAVFERLFVTFEAALGIGTGHAWGRVVEPLAGAFQVRARHAREALTDADVGAAAVERVELRREELVPELKRLIKGLVADVLPRPDSSVPFD